MIRMIIRTIEFCDSHDSMIRVIIRTITPSQRVIVGLYVSLLSTSECRWTPVVFYCPVSDSRL